jgi:serine/threonine protein kinase
VEYKPPTAQPVKRLGANKLIEMFSNRLSICDPQVPSHSKSIEELQVSKSKSTYNTLTVIPLEHESLSLKYKDFNFLNLLGEGSFGQVYLVECLRNKKLYALKIFQKKKIILSKQTKFVIAEVNILKQISHPFIISLYFTFQTPNYIYLGLQYCAGKDLAKHLNQEMTFSEDDVRLYAAEILLAIEYIHSIGIIYRDLKPDNIMLGKDGHVLLVDFGLSKKTENNFAKTFCGSPAYLSPEMLDRHGVGPESDYFTLGVVIYELIFGEPPFFSDNIHLLYDNIKNARIKFPMKIRPATQTFLLALLEKDPKLRLGSKSIEDIKNHEYFFGLDWGKVMRKEYPAPRR